MKKQDITKTSISIDVKKRFNKKITALTVNGINLQEWIKKSPDEQIMFLKEQTAAAKGKIVDYQVK